MHQHKFQEQAAIVDHYNYRGEYYCITFHSPNISPCVLPGQFVHMRLPNSPELLLRRPFSVYNAEPLEKTISIIYKVIGCGTRKLSVLSIGESVNLLGPLGTSFPSAEHDRKIIIVAGGYGCASTYLVAKHAQEPGICLLGARGRDDILVVDEFERTGFEVRISTDDGSYGRKGLVTDLLTDVLDRIDVTPMICACGPNAMLTAVGGICMNYGYEAYLSFDLPMCCGVGACFTCVIKKKADNDDGWNYVRTCKSGPVLKASEIYWE